MSSRVLRGALIGALVGAVLRLFLLLLRRALPWLILIFGLLFVLDRCSPDYPHMAQRRAIRDSFDERSVTISGTQGLLMDYHRPVVDRVTATVHNGGRARIYDLWLSCTFGGRSPQSRIEVPMEGRQRISSSYHYGYIEPGQRVRVELELESNGNLSRADPNSFECEPRFEVERSDLFKMKR